MRVPSSLLLHIGSTATRCLDGSTDQEEPMTVATAPRTIDATAARACRCRTDRGRRRARDTRRRRITDRGDPGDRLRHRGSYLPGAVHRDRGHQGRAHPPRRDARAGDRVRCVRSRARQLGPAGAVPVAVVDIGAENRRGVQRRPRRCRGPRSIRRRSPAASCASRGRRRRSGSRDACGSISRPR